MRNVVFAHICDFGFIKSLCRENQKITNDSFLFLFKAFRFTWCIYFVKIIFIILFKRDLKTTNQTWIIKRCCFTGVAGDSPLQ